jgi:hypothetical protein
MSISSSAVGIGYLVGERGAGFERAEAYRLRAAQTRRPVWTTTDRSMRRTLRSFAFVTVPNS